MKRRGFIKGTQSVDCALVGYPIPGMPVPAKDGPALFFGALSHREMERIQVLHFLNHLELLEWTQV